MGLSGAPSQPTTTLSRPLRFAVARTATFDPPSPSFRVQRHGKCRQSGAKTSGSGGSRTVEQLRWSRKTYSIRAVDVTVVLSACIFFSAIFCILVCDECTQTFDVSAKPIHCQLFKQSPSKIMHLLRVALLEERNTPQTPARCSNVQLRTCSNALLSRSASRE